MALGVLEGPGGQGGVREVGQDSKIMAGSMGWHWEEGSGLLYHMKNIAKRDAGKAILNT